ncbi:MAG: preprotein translocase subunit SecG [Sphingobacteriales bacterium]|jgi:preprotein translocase subunit SecG
MYTFLTILTVVICALLVLVVLVQNPKGGGLSSSFGGAGASQMMGGVKRTGDFLEQSTWTLAIALMVLSLSLTFFSPNQDTATGVGNSEMQEQIDNLPSQAPTATPSAVPGLDAGNDDQGEN